MKLFAWVVFFEFSSLQLSRSQDQQVDFEKYKSIDAEQFIEEVVSDGNTGPGALKTRMIAEFILNERRDDLFEMGLDHWRLRHDFWMILEQSEESPRKDDMVLYLLKNSSIFLDYGSDFGSFPASGSQANPFLYLFKKYLPGMPVNPLDFDYPARRKPLVDKLEAAMEEKRKPRELRRPDASDFEERSGNHVRKVNAAESSPTDARDFLKPVPIGIAAGIAALLALLGFRKIKKAQ